MANLDDIPGYLVILLRIGYIICHHNFLLSCQRLGLTDIHPEHQISVVLSAFCFYRRSGWRQSIGGILRFDSDIFCSCCFELLCMNSLL